MHIKTILASLALAGAVTLGASAASATVINFDDLSGTGTLADGYGGVTWGGAWDYYDAGQDPYNPASPPERVYANQCCDYGETAFSFSGPVVFNGAAFSGYGSDYGNGLVSFNLYNGGVLVASSGSLDVSGTPTFLASGYGGLVDEVRVLGNRDLYVMDDVTFNGAGVPEPAMWSLMIAGFGLAGAALRRRDRATA